jgi:hypothetical protein
MINRIRAAAQWLSPVGWLITVGLLAVLITCMWWLFIGGPAAARREAALARAEATMGTAHTESAKDAVGAVAAAGRRDAGIDQSVRETENAIRNAPEDQRGAIAVRALCLSDSARNDPACRQLRESRPR